MKKITIIVVLLALSFLAGYYSKQANPLGAAGENLFTGIATTGEISVATTDTNVVGRDSARQYLKICKTNPSSSDLRQITLAVNASASHGRGFVLDARVPCQEFAGLTLVTGLIEAVASPSAASVSYTSW